jgi:hypothetical protein
VQACPNGSCGWELLPVPGSKLGHLPGWKSAGGEKAVASETFTLDDALVGSASVKQLTTSIEAAG